MKRNQYIISKRNGEKMVAYANGYDVSASGTLSLGQVHEHNGQPYTALVLSLQPDQWESIHQQDGERPKYMETGMIKSAGVLAVQ